MLGLILASLIRAIDTQRDDTCEKEIPEDGCIQNLYFIDRVGFHNIVILWSARTL